MVVLIQKRVHLEYWIRLDYRLFLAVRILCSFKALMCRAHLSEKVRYKVYKVSQKYLIILPPLFCWDIYILLLYYFIIIIITLYFITLFITLLFIFYYWEPT